MYHNKHMDEIQRLVDEAVAENEQVMADIAKMQLAEERVNRFVVILLEDEGACLLRGLVAGTAQEWDAAIEFAKIAAECTGFWVRVVDTQLGES